MEAFSVVFEVANRRIGQRRHWGIRNARKTGVLQRLAAELARALGVSQQTVFAYELGDRRVSVLMLAKLARIFDTSVEELAGLKMPIRSKRRLSPAGVRHAECYQKLSKMDQRCVKKIIDTLLERVAAQGSVACT